MNRIGQILLNPFFISLPISILFILLLPPFFDKYKTEQVNKQYRYESKVYYNDLNNDSFSEYIYLNYNGNRTPNDSIYNAPAIQIDTDCSANKLSNIIDQFNFTKKWFNNQNLYFGDFDHDGFKEIYFFTFSNDSLFIQGLDAFKRNGFFLEKFICRFNYYNNSPDLVFGKIDIDSDLTGDNNNEIVGSVIGGFTASPRFIFAYDIINKSLVKSKTSSINLYVNDIVQDNTFISTTNYAPGNVNDSLLLESKFSDQSSWLVIIDKNLDFVFPPIENKGLTSSVVACFQKENDDIFVYALFFPPGGKGFSLLKKYNMEGVEIISRSFMDSNEMGICQKQEENEEILYLREMNEFSRIDENLNFMNTQKVEFKHFLFTDLDFDGNQEIFNWQEGEEFAYIYTSNFAHPSIVKIKDLFRGYILSACKFKDNSANFAIHSGDFVYYFKYFKNPLYYLKYPFHLGIYLVISFLFFVVMYFQRKSLVSKFEQEKKMTELELLTIKNQMDPHFTFNAINTASLVVYNEDKKTAYKFLVDFSNLIRNTLKNSKEISVSLKDEIEFVQNYLHIQQFRHDFLFDYKIDVADDIDQNREVPKMIIQTFAENAIKHGLVYKKEKGNLDILIHPITSNHRRAKPVGIKVEIIDNGIGRKKATELKKQQIISTGKGHDIINQIIMMYNKLKTGKVSYKIEDLYENSKAVGTKVIILIPVSETT